MDRTYRQPLDIDPETQTLRYRCYCGEIHSFPLAEIVADVHFYCDVCNTKTTFTADNITSYYKRIGITKIDQ